MEFALAGGKVFAQIVRVDLPLSRADASERAKALVEAHARSEGSALGPPASSPLTWSVTNSGRPFLREVPDWSFSISHSGPYLGFAAACFPVGFDLEAHQPFPDGGRRRLRRTLLRRLAPAERSWVEDASTDRGELLDDLQGRRFLEIWTKKEAYLKWLGTGIDSSLKAFDVTDEPSLGVAFIPIGPTQDRKLTAAVCLSWDQLAPDPQT